MRVRLGTVGAIVVAVYEDDVDAAGADAAMKLLLAHADALGRPVGFLDVVAVRTKPPPEDARTVFVDAMRKFGDKCAATAVVSEGTGFFAALVRSVVTGIAFVARPPFPIDTFATVDDAAIWLATRVPGSSAAAIVEAVRALRLPSEGASS